MMRQRKGHIDKLRREFDNFASNRTTFPLNKSLQKTIKIKSTKGLQLIANQFFKKNTVTKAVLKVSRMRILCTESSLIH